MKSGINVVVEVAEVVVGAWEKSVMSESRLGDVKELLGRRLLFIIHG